MDPKLITPILLTALVAWGIFRRVRRTFGRQPVHVAQIWVRISVLALVGGLVVVTSTLRDLRMVEALIAGIACGAMLAYVGLLHTQFELTPEGRFYTPHTYIGLVVTALFLGRIVYRLIYLSYGAHAMIGANQSLALGYQRNPLTAGIFIALACYYVLFYAGVLFRTRSSALSMRDEASPGA
jgi:hypothetical protein